MAAYSSMDKNTLNEEYNKLSQAYEAYKAQGLSLNMARGKPCSQQLDISNDILNALTPETDFKAPDCPDCRNYGNLDGICFA